MKKIFIFLKNILKAKILFKNPETREVVIFNSYQLNTYKELFEKKNYFCIEVPETGSDDYATLQGNKIEYI